MKAKGGVTQTQVVEGSISKAELLALVRDTFHIPEGATARFYTVTYAYQAQLLAHGAIGTPLVDVTDEHPLKFRITWEVPLAEKQG
jgi:hypothetical protein